jgi:hypothetical protein
VNEHDEVAASGDSYVIAQPLRLAGAGLKGLPVLPSK